jgi:predicted enzyme related to lactoylglutathione lyase
MINCLCGLKMNDPLRERTCAGLEGELVEIGFGSGLNIPFYPERVSRVSAVEPADIGWKLAEKRLAETRVPVERSGLDGQSLPFPDDSFDTALSTWTMCTIPDIDAALAEVRRVLKPGGKLHFIEHGLAPERRLHDRRPRPVLRGRRAEVPGRRLARRRRVAMNFKLELIAVPVSDADRAKAFYADQVGFAVDHDHAVKEGLRFIQLTPAGSGCAIAIGEGVTEMEPGSLEGLQLVVDDIEAARNELAGRGVEVSAIQDFPWGRFVFFSDPDGNRWAVQQIPDYG